MSNGSESSKKVITVVIGGAAGDGVREAGSNLTQMLAKSGFEAFCSTDYPSLIRGGHNFSRISFSNEKIFNDHTEIDILVALNEETLKVHRNELKKDAIVFADSFDEEDVKVFGVNAVVLPMTETAKSSSAPLIARNSVALGAVCYLLDLSFEKMIGILHKVFQEKNLEFNVKLAEIGYEHLKKVNLKHSKKIELNSKKKEVIDASSAFSKGLVKAGLNFYIAYPMTPSSPILHYMAKNQKNFGIKVIQPENELSVINMALGVAFAGKRAAIGTAGGGFALMQEAFSLSGMTETPLVVALCQRPAPATGVPTYTSQGDLLWAINSGHGEFPRIVLAPGDAEEAFYLGADALNLAWKYQLPVITLLDKHINESFLTGGFDEGKINVEKEKLIDKVGGEYKRYRFSQDGVSPMAFPGTLGATIKVNSYEHDEQGLTIEEPEMVKKMQDKRFSKLKGILKDMESRETVKIYGDKNSRNVVIFWGSTKGAVLEAQKYLRNPVKFVQVVWMEPFDGKKVFDALKDAKIIVDVEVNHEAQLASLIRQKTGVEIKNKILKYDGRPFDPLKLAEELNSLVN